MQQKRRLTQSPPRARSIQRRTQGLNEGVVEQIVGRRKWDAHAPLGEGIPASDEAASQHVPRNIVDAVVHLIGSGGMHGTGTVVHLEKRFKAHTPPSGVCEQIHVHRATQSVHAVITCLHVIPTRTAARVTKAHIGTKVYTLNPDQLFYANDCNDVVVCAFAGAAVSSNLCPRGWDVSWSQKPLSLVHFPNAVRRPVLTSGQVIAHVAHCFLHTADTLPGSSGAPVFVRVGNKWHWVGIHCEAIDLTFPGRADVPTNAGCSLEVALRALKHVGYGCAASTVVSRD